MTVTPDHPQCDSNSRPPTGMLLPAPPPEGIRMFSEEVSGAPAPATATFEVVGGTCSSAAPPASGPVGTDSPPSCFNRGGMGIEAASVVVAPKGSPPSETAPPPILGVGRRFDDTSAAIKALAEEASPPVWGRVPPTVAKR